MPISDSQLTTLKQAAIDASRNAWCPYSNFRVGAALLAADGRIFAGCNIENASHGLTICAERNAMGNAIGAGCREFEALLIFTATQKPTAPCGACRQVIIEFAPDIDVISVCEASDEIRVSIRELLPHNFGPHSLNETNELN
jgi:cytidine deaminase